MKLIEYGHEHDEVIVLLHGGGLSWWNFRESGQLLSKRFHVILPVLDGHAGSTEDFTGIGDNARRIISLIDERFAGRVLLIGGLSLGAQIAVEILSCRPDICRYALLESPSLIPSPALAPYFSPAWSFIYRLMYCRWFAKWQFAYLRIQPELFEEYYEATCGISIPNLLAFLKASVMYALPPSLSCSRACSLILCGEKEQSVIRRSAYLLHEVLPGSTFKVKEKLYHGELSLNHPEEYVQEILSLIEK